ncbi:MAG: class C sortase [Clostridia bacterium]|nr:class C sortase [Clostridia bacterium]
MKETTNTNKEKKKKKTKKSGRSSTILLVVIIIAGLSLLLYPSVSNYWNSLHASRAIADYVSAVNNLDAEHYTELIRNARKYNEDLASSYFMAKFGLEQREAYNAQLNVIDTGIMGYIEIKKINCFLPIYHGTSNTVLQIAVGHLENSSLPVGGKNTHCVLSGHRGLPSARLFTDLDKMELGDTFIIQVLNETLTYQVDQIRIVLPTQLDEIQLVPQRDYCTLVTCTPYGINTHRMLVRGHRIDNEEQAMEVRVIGDALRIRPTIVAPILSVPMFITLFIVLNVRSGREKKRRRVMRLEMQAQNYTSQS